MFLQNHKEDDLFYLSKKQLFKDYSIRKHIHPIYLKSCQFFGATLIDRTETLDSGLKFRIIDKIPKGTCQLSFEEICTLRARQIINQTKAGFKILWSGGIDSTLALVAILIELKKSDELHRLTIVLSKESILEYPTFFDDIIKDKLEYQFIDKTIYDSITSSDIIVTGEHGDQLFGSDKLKYPILSGDAYSPFEEIIDFIISRKLGSEKYTYDIIDYLAPLIKKAPFKIITLYDYMWWLNFSLKWQTVSLRLIHGLNRTASDLEKTVFHFFKNEDFQKWSISNHDKKIKKEWNSYKFIAKEFIYTYHQDTNYLINKEKEPSLKEVIVANREQGNLKKKALSILNKLNTGKKMYTV